MLTYVNLIEFVTEIKIQFMRLEGNVIIAWFSRKVDMGKSNDYYFDVYTNTKIYHVAENVLLFGGKPRSGAP